MSKNIESNKLSPKIIEVPEFSSDFIHSSVKSYSVGDVSAINSIKRELQANGATFNEKGDSISNSGIVIDEAIEEADLKDRGKGEEYEVAPEFLESKEELFYNGLTGKTLNSNGVTLYKVKLADGTITYAEVLE